MSYQKQKYFQKKRCLALELIKLKKENLET